MTNNVVSQDEIIEMARKAGFIVDDECYIRFAKLVAAKEREACAKFIEDGYVGQFENPWREDLAAAIRERGEA